MRILMIPDGKVKKLVLPESVDLTKGDLSKHFEWCKYRPQEKYLGVDRHQPARTPEGFPRE